MTTNDIEALCVVVKVNGKIHQVITKNENNDLYLRTIDFAENGIKLIEKPLDNLIIEITNKQEQGK